MIKIKKSDSIIDIIQKIQKEKDKEIILDFPFGHPVLHNYLSLKILKNKAGTKPLKIITSDIASRNIGKRLGIKYSIIREKNDKEDNNLVKSNMGFWEYLFYEIKSYFSIFLSIFSKTPNIEEFKKYTLKYYNKKGIGIFLFILFVSILILFIVIFFVVNKTYIKINPRVNVSTVSWNFVFKDFGDSEPVNLDDRTVKLKKVTKTISLEDNFNTTGILAGTGGKKSSGEIMLYNTFLEEITLKKNTRIQDKTGGLIFETQFELIIPAGTQEGTGEIIPGILKTKVIARDYDAFGIYIGSRGNEIEEGHSFFLPGLTGNNKDKIYASALENFGGGNDLFTKVVGEKDLENAKNTITNKLEKEALNSIKEHISKENSTNITVYDILTYDGIFDDSNIKIDLPDLQVGDKVENFTVNGKIDLTFYIYNKNTVINKLITVANDRIYKEQQTVKGKMVIDEGEKFLGVNEDSLRPAQTVYEEKVPRYEAKITMEIDASTYKNFLSTNSFYIEKLKNSIFGKTKDEAKKILENDDNISTVEIKIQPFFINTISNNENDIIFEINNPN